MVAKEKGNPVHTGVTNKLNTSYNKEETSNFLSLKTLFLSLFIFILFPTIKIYSANVNRSIVFLEDKNQ